MAIVQDIGANNVSLSRLDERRDPRPGGWLQVSPRVPTQQLRCSVPSERTGAPCGRLSADGRSELCENHRPITFKGK